MSKAAKRSGSLILRIVLAVFSVWMVVYLGYLIRQYTSVQAELRLAEKKRDQLILEIKSKAQLLDSGEDSDFIERAAREKLGYVYSEEHVYIDISGN